MDAELARKYPEIPPESGFHDRWYPLLASRFGKVVPMRKALYSYRIHSNNVAGVTPFKGIFVRAGNQKAGFSGIIEKCAQVWRDSNALAKATERQGVSLSFFQKQAFVSGWDFGALLGFYGLLMIWSDPALARAAWARAFGKILVELRVAKPVGR
jgi:hypothetical protein